jgi:acetyl-CoA C-acetyltransferase
MRRVAILGAAQTRHSACRDDVNYMELAFEVVQALLESTGWSHDRVDTVISASSDFWDGRTISDIAIQEAAGAAGKSESKVSMDGAFALVYAAARVASGRHRTCLVVAHGKGSEGSPRLIANAAFDPVFERPLGIDDHVALGLQARRFLDRRGLPERALAEAAARSAARAAENPYVDRREARHVLVADPLHEDEIAPDSDGACALLLADEETARGRDVAWLEGFDCATDAPGLGERDLGDPGLLAGVAHAACRMAGVEPREIDVGEVHDASSAQTLLWAEALGLRDVNPSGGAMGAQPGFATGLVRVAEVFERLRRGEGRVGLAHGMTGFTGQAHCVWILGRR